MNTASLTIEMKAKTKSAVEINLLGAGSRMRGVQGLLHKAFVWLLVEARSFGDSGAKVSRTSSLAKVRSSDTHSKSKLVISALKSRRFLPLKS
jgi:hypothetical protein